MEMLGIDVGGSGIKGAPVDTISGELTKERLRIPTPSPSTPDAVAATVREIADHFGWTGPMGVTYPGVVLDGVIKTAANVDRSWIGRKASELFGDDVTLLNDADAAGIAEIEHGAGRGHAGLVLVLTFGTGIGSALFLDGRLVPNTEFGHLELHGKVAEHRASDHARESHDLSWPDWAERVQEYLTHVRNLLWPSLIIIGGGVSKKADKFLPHIDLGDTPVVPAGLRNEAGIVGAAMAATGRLAVRVR
jgi:polyphosphate glucokinase